MTAPAIAPDPVASKGKGKKPLIMIVVAVLVLGAGYFFFLRPSGHAEASHEPVPGPVVDLEPLTLNLADGRFLKVGLSLQTSADAAGGGGGHGAAVEELNGAKARDAAIAIFGQRTYAQLLAPKGREAARKALDTEVKHRYEGEVLKVYLTEFVMQ